MDDAGRDGQGLFGWASGGPAGSRRVGAALRVAAHLAHNSNTKHSHITHAQIFNTQQRAVKPARSRAQQSGTPCTCGRSTGPSAGAHGLVTGCLCRAAAAHGLVKGCLCRAAAARRERLEAMRPPCHTPCPRGCRWVSSWMTLGVMVKASSGGPPAALPGADVWAQHRA